MVACAVVSSCDEGAVQWLRDRSSLWDATRSVILEMALEHGNPAVVSRLMQTFSSTERARAIAGGYGGRSVLLNACCHLPSQGHVEAITALLDNTNEEEHRQLRGGDEDWWTPFEAVVYKLITHFANDWDGGESASRLQNVAHQLHARGMATGNHIVSMRVHGQHAMRVVGWMLGPAVVRSMPLHVRIIIAADAIDGDQKEGRALLVWRADPLATLTQLQDSDPGAKLRIRYDSEPAAGDGVRRAWFQQVGEALMGPAGRAIVYQTAGQTAVHPRHDADRGTLFAIGRLCVSALVHGETLGLPLTEATVRAIFGYEIPPACARELDPVAYDNQIEWTRTCSEREWAEAGLELTFVDDADDDTPLLSGGRAIQVCTEEQRKQYADLLAQHRSRGRYERAYDALASGARAAVGADYLAVLRATITAAELTQHLAGERVGVGDILQAAMIEDEVVGGPHMAWVMDWLGAAPHRPAWFVRFATGLSRAPVGGLELLRGHNGAPQPLTIAGASPHGAVPLASTCSTGHATAPRYTGEVCVGAGHRR